MKILSNNIKKIKLTLIIISIIFILIFIIPKFIPNNGLEQLSIVDKMKFTYVYVLMYKRGLFGFRKNDVINLKKYFCYDPIGIKSFKHINNNYKYGVAVADMYIRKVYVIGNPDIVKFILKNSPNMFGPSTFKHIFMGKVMPKNVGMIKCPFSQTNICKKYKKLRVMNEDVFKTKKEIDFYDIIYDSLDKNINYKLQKPDDFKNLTFNSMAVLYFGHNNVKLQKLLKNMFDFFAIDTNIGPKTLFQKITVKRKPIENVANYIRNNNMNDSIFSRFKNYERMSSKHFDLSNELPHWLGPYVAMIDFFFPIFLHIILKRKDVYVKIKKELNTSMLNLKSKKSYIHYCVIEFFRLFNIISVQMFRIVQNDITYKDVFFPKGTEIAINLPTLLRDENEFKNPDDFIPERWENRSIEEQHIVFGFGTQRCPSINFSPLIYKCLLHILLTKFDYKLNKNQYFDTRVPHWIDGFNLTFK
tara:strand:+ start:819 stop:2234 length:1416 start_codon:yes stop_codon:yes gene_type:complete